MRRGQHNFDEQLRMPEESDEKKSEPKEQPSAEGQKASTSRQGRRMTLTAEEASELQARQRAIGVELRRIFDDVTKEPVPKELLELLDKIERKRED